MTDDTMDDARVAQIERNIELAFQFAKELVDDPTRLAELPSEATVFVAPPDDPEFTEAQLERAMRAAKTNKQVYLWRLGAPTGERAAFQARVITPRWPTRGV